MIETGLIIAQVAFLVLLYLFVWAVVRSSGRQLRDPAPDPRRAPRPSPVVGPPAPPPAPEPVAEHAHAPAPQVDAAPIPVVPVPVPAPGTEPMLDAVVAPAEPAPVDPDPAPVELAPDAAVPGDASAADRSTRRRTGDTGVMDLSEHIDPRLIVERSAALADGEKIDLAGGLTIGRSGSNDVTIDDPFVSHIHARVLRRGPYYYVEDLGSTNGTYLNDQRVDGDARLKVRDTLRLGETVLRYEE